MIFFFDNYFDFGDALRAVLMIQLILSKLLINADADIRATISPATLMVPPTTVRHSKATGSNTTDIVMHHDSWPYSLLGYDASRRFRLGCIRHRIHFTAQYLAVLIWPSH